MAVPQQIMDFLVRDWVWIVIVLILIGIILAMRNKFIRKKLNSLFGWPPSP